MSGKQKNLLIRICVSVVLFAAAWLIPAGELVKLTVYIVTYLIIGYSVLIKAIKNIIRGQVFDENFLMAIATLGAFAVREYPEAVFVMIFYETGELFESIAVGKSRRSIAALMDIHPDYANVVRDGNIIKVPPEEVAVGETIIIKPGEKIPLDGAVVSGSSSINTVALTGESLPRDVAVGDSVFSGCINISGLIRVEVSCLYGESTVAKILDLVENSALNKAKSEGFITRFAKYYTPCVVVGAVLLAVIPPLFSGAWGLWIYRALSFLVISCPCALVISVPLSFFSGIGCASKNGILVKGSNYLELLASAGIAVFDKTGTLTEGSFKVTAVHPEKISKDELLELAAFAECYSTHPISSSLRDAYKNNIDKSRVGKVDEIAGHGVCAEIDGAKVYVGNGKLMDSIGAKWRDCHLHGTIVHVASDSGSGAEYMGHIAISDSIKKGSAQALSELKRLGVRKNVMLTGDLKTVAERVAAEIGIDEIHAELLPDKKVDEVQKLISEKKKGEVLVFIGDGINDAPVLSRADVGVAMGALGSDAAIEAADVVIMDDDPRRLALGVKIARRTKAIVKQNITFALVVKAAVLVLSAVGISTMWEAVFADVGVMIIAVLNSMRAMRGK